MYNLSNLEPKFKSFLYAENISLISLRNYLSDIRHFLGWAISNDILPDNPNNSNNYFSLITAEIIKKYKTDHLKSSLPVKTINRRLSALRKFFLFLEKEGLAKENPAKAVNNVSLIKKTKTIKKIVSDSASQRKSEDMRFEQITEGDPHQRVSVCEKRHIELFSLKFSKQLPTIFLILFSLSFFIFSLLSKQKIITPIIQAAPTSNRYLAFNGRLTDKLGNPITTKTDVEFNLYNRPSDGVPVYSSLCVGSDRAIIPDVNGNFRVLIGKDCDGNPISTSIFLENPNLYLGLTLGSDSEMKPRQKIPNVGYALNTDTIGGLNLGTTPLSVPFINQDHDLIIEAADPGIHSSSEGSNFTLSSTDTITVQSANLGDVVLQATDSGGIKLRTGGISDLYTRLLINSEGNIGIGTLFPSYGLEVNDDIKITDGNRFILGSSTSDPTGVNGSLYYNSILNKFRCFQAGNWVDCFSQTEKNPVGGIYDGTLTNNSPISKLESDLSEIKRGLDDLNTKIDKIKQTTSDNMQDLTSNFISVREKIISPIVETSQVETNEIKPKNGHLILDLTNNTQVRTDAVGESDETSDGKTASVNQVKGPLASLIIRGLEGKTVATIDAAGNASFSGTLTAKEASVSGKLTAKEIEAENINRLQARTSAVEERSGKTAEVNEKLASDVNNIQTLLSDIKNQPLPDAQYYQSLPNSQQLTTSNVVDAINNEIMEQLTVTGDSNLYNLSVSGSGTIGSLLLEDNSILSLAWDLKLSALSSIKLFEDAVVISKDGTITTKGKLIAHDGIKTNKIEPINQAEAVTINNPVVNNLAISDKFIFDEDNPPSPTIETNTASAGNAIIPQQTSEITIYNDSIKENSLIYLTPTTPALNSLLTVSKQESCNNVNIETMEQFNNEVKCKPYFKVSIDSALSGPLEFNWLIIN